MNIIEKVILGNIFLESYDLPRKSYLELKNSSKNFKWCPIASFMQIMEI